MRVTAVLIGDVHVLLSSFHLPALLLRDTTPEGDISSTSLALLLFFSA
jgi:hypothetical protein